MPPEGSFGNEIVGFSYVSEGRTVSGSENALLCNLAWTRGPMHTNRDAAQASILGGLSLPGPLVTAVVSGLWSSGAFGHQIEGQFGLQLLAVLETRTRYLLPLFVDETMHAEATVVEIRWSERHPGRASLIVEVAALVDAPDPRQVVEITEVLLAQRLER